MDFGPGWLEEQSKGWLAAARERPAHWHLQRLLQNALDTSSSQVRLELQGEKDGGWFRLTFDSATLPEQLTPGSLFPSGRRDSALLRGRRGRCLNEMAAACDELTISCGNRDFSIVYGGTPPLSVRHRITGPKEVRITGRCARWKTSSMAAATSLLWEVRPPADKEVFLNGQLLERRPAWSAHKLPLETLFFDPDGGSYLREELTTIELLELQPEEDSALLELGFPVEPLGLPWHVDVLQRIPRESKKEQAPPYWRSNLLRLLLTLRTDQMEQAGPPKRRTAQK